MALIERTQKTVLFDEAARKGITRFQLESVPATYRSLLGVPDVGVQQFGIPTAPLYRAVDGEPVRIDKMSAFLTGLNRDARVAEQALSTVESEVASWREQVWARSQLLKNRSLALSRTAAAEQARSSNQASWTFSDSFTDTTWLDMAATTAWLDGSEGSMFLPTSGPSASVPPAAIEAGEASLSPGVDSLGSTPSMASDGLETTNWRAQFTAAGQRASAVFRLSEPTDVSSIQVDPTGFGIQCWIEADNGDGFKEVSSDVLYAKTTVLASVKKARAFRVSFTSVGAALPKAAGIRSLRFFTSDVSDEATVRSKAVGVPVPYTEVRFDYSAKIPDGAKIRSYYSLDGLVWKEAPKGAWTTVRDLTTASVELDRDEVSNENGLWKIEVDAEPSSRSSGTMQVGRGQVQVTTMRKDFVANGELPHIPSLADFAASGVRTYTTWLDVGYYSLRSTYPNHLYMVPSKSQVSPVARGAGILPFEFQVDGEPYRDMAFLLMAGTLSSRIAQPNHTYRTSFKVYASRDYVVDGSRWFFYQGTRSRSGRTFRDSGRAFGAFSVYVNDSLVASSDKPYTVYDTESSGSYIEGGSSGLGEAGSPFTIPLKTGWNTIDVLVHTLDPATYGSDPSMPDGYYPYLQLSMYPSLFDPRLQEAAGIDQVVASGEVPPVSEFELLWNVPQDPRFWAWSEDSASVKFNVWEPATVDGFLKGPGPRYTLFYRGLPEALAAYSEIRARFDLVRDASTGAGPTLDGYQVMVR